MKKFFNSFFGGFFRKLGSIFATLIILFILGYALTLNYDDLGGKFKKILFNIIGINYVYAEETSGYGKAEFMDCTAGMSNSGIIDSSNTRCSEWLNFGTEDSWGGSYPYRWLYNFKYFITSGNYTYSTNREYRISVVLVLNPKYFDDFLQSINKADLRIEGGTTTSTSSLSSNNIQSGSVSWYVNDYSSNAYWVDLSVKFVPTKDLKSVWINWQFHKPDDNDAAGTGLGLTDFQIYRVNSVTYSDISGSNADVTNAINNQTNVINNNFNNTNNNINKVNDSINNINDSLNDDNVDDATDAASNFFSDFTTNTHGLTGIITAPLNAIESLVSKNCSPLVLPIPFVNTNITLPCMRSIYDEFFGSFMTIYDVVTLGIVSYWVMVKIFGLVKDFKNPDHDEIEVMDL